VIVTAIAFAVTVQFYARGQLGPLDTLRFMAFAAVPMLQYALPFAAGLAATLAYHRLAQDNEITAARAGGMSHAAILAPALIAGVILAGTLGLLSDRVIPRFLRGMEELVSQKIATVIANTINNNQSFQYDRYMLHADEVLQLAPEPGSGVESELVLFGAVFVELDERGDVLRQGSARQVRLWVRPGESGVDGRVSHVVLRAEDVVTGDEAAPAARLGSIDHTLALPSGINDDPKFLTSAELRQARQRPEMLNVVDIRRRDLLYHIGKARILEQVESNLRLGTPIEFEFKERAAGAGDRLVLRAGGVQREGDWLVLLPLRGRGTIQAELHTCAGAELFEAPRGDFRVVLTGDPGNRSLDLRIALRDAVQPRTPGEHVPPIPEKIFAELDLQPDPLPGLLRQSSQALLQEAQRLSEGEDAIAWIHPPMRDLRNRIARMEREILSKRHERRAMSAACFVMIATGAIMAMRLGSASPLAVYMWSFFPAIVAVLTISGGQQMTYQSGPVGLLILWGGVAALAAYAGGVLLSLMRH